jgi:hypothetical protein
MARIARIVYNTNGWINPTKNDNIGIFVNQPGNNYYFGLEEWLFNPEFIKRNIGYLDCYRIHNYRLEDKVLLVTKNPDEDCYYHVATISKVVSIRQNQIASIRADLGPDFLEMVNNHFTQPPFNDPRNIINHEYFNNWNSNNIIAPAPNGFIANIKYESFKILDKAVNLTALDKNINDRKISKLSVLYKTETIIDGDFSKKLKEYLLTQR